MGDSSQVSGGEVGGAILLSLVIILVAYLVVGFVLGKVFQKAGRPRWAAFVPVYNTWVLFEIGGRPGWWAIFSLIPYLGALIILVLTLIVSIDIAKRFGKSPAFGVIGLWLFSFIGYLILAFGSAKYQGGDIATATPFPATVPGPSLSPVTPPPATFGPTPGADTYTNPGEPKDPTPPTAPLVQ